MINNFCAIRVHRFADGEFTKSADDVSPGCGARLVDVHFAGLGVQESMVVLTQAGTSAKLHRLDPTSGAWDVVGIVNSVRGSITGAALRASDGATVVAAVEDSTGGACVDRVYVLEPGSSSIELLGDISSIGTSSCDNFHVAASPVDASVAVVRALQNGIEYRYEIRTWDGQDWTLEIPPHQFPDETPLRVHAAYTPSGDLVVYSYYGFGCTVEQVKFANGTWQVGCLPSAAQRTQACRAARRTAKERGSS